MPTALQKPSKILANDIVASIAVFLVAVPLCLGIALASNAPLISGIIAGIVGGILVGWLSGSHKSVSGPAAGLTAVVAAQIVTLGSFEAFLAAVLIAGCFQVGLGSLKLGFISAFFPSNVIKGLLSAIGLILILKQIPHLFGHDADAEGDLSFAQADAQNTFTELFAILSDLQIGAAIVGVVSVVLLIVWGRTPRLKALPIPSALAVVLLGVLANFIFKMGAGTLAIESSHLVEVPVTNLAGQLVFPAWAQFSNGAVYVAAVTLALVASLETLLNLQAADKMDPDQQKSPPNRELIAQGVGNIVCGLIGGLPITSVIVRTSVNIQAGGRTKRSAIFHGGLLILCVALIPAVLNLIPLASLAAILIVTGLKLASPKLFKQMWSEGHEQFLPFMATIIAIIATDLLKGIALGLCVSILFILHRNLSRPLRRTREMHASGEVMRIDLGNQVSFLNRATLERTLHAVPRGGHILIDARATDYLDPDVRDLICDFRDTTSKAHGVELSLVGLRDHYQMADRIQFVDYTSREIQGGLTPASVLQILQAGNQRFLKGERIQRDFSRQVSATALGQFPMAVALSCIDSRAPAEVVFDLGLGDIFNIRVAGNIAATEQLGSAEYACVVAGAKLLVVLGHTSCGAVNAAVDLLGAQKKASEATGCGNLDSLIIEIQQSVPLDLLTPEKWSPAQKAAFSNNVSRRNVVRTISKIRERSPALDKLVQEGAIAIVGALYDITTGEVDFFQTPSSSLAKLDLAMA